MLKSLRQLNAERFETPVILKQLNLASRRLAELKGVIASIPNQGILINTLVLQEAKDSSAIENIITTHDELFQTEARGNAGKPAVKEVARYREALNEGYLAVRKNQLLTTNAILKIHATLEPNKPGLRKIPGTTLKRHDGAVIYTPPTPEKLAGLLRDLEQFMNDDSLLSADPLIKMALIHHQFESIHPFYDGNGRTGRIINVLYLVKQQLLDIPVLYLSRHIVRTKTDYYRLLQAVRDTDAWEDWVIYILQAVELIAQESIEMIQSIKKLLLETKRKIRDKHSNFYSQDLINILFTHPYTRVEHVAKGLDVTRVTATKYLNELTESEILIKQKIARANYYINLPLYELLSKSKMEDA